MQTKKGGATGGEPATVSARPWAAQAPPTPIQRSKPAAVLHKSMDATLQAALGSPPTGGRLPTAVSPLWRAARTCLAAALALAGCTARVRSAMQLWRLVHGDRPLPVGATWGQLCHNYRLTHVTDALSLRTACTTYIPFVSWNCRWLTDLQSEQGRRKQQAIKQQLAQGKVVLLQETHWDDAAAEHWAGALGQVSVAHAAATAGPSGRPHGGVAVLVPRPFLLANQTVLDPGCGVEARVEDPRGRATGQLFS